MKLILFIPIMALWAPLFLLRLWRRAGQRRESGNGRSRPGRRRCDGAGTGGSKRPGRRGCDRRGQRGHRRRRIAFQDEFPDLFPIQPHKNLHLVGARQPL